MDAPKFTLLMPIRTNAVGILRPDEWDGRAPQWVVLGIRIDRVVVFGLDDNTVELCGYSYLVADRNEEPNQDYGWVSEAELVKQEYPAPADDTVPLEEHPDLDDVRNMPATTVG